MFLLLLLTQAPEDDHRSARAARGKRTSSSIVWQGRYVVVPPSASDIIAIGIIQIRLSHHAIGRRHPLRFPPNTACVEEQGDDQCGGKLSRCTPYLERTLRSAHHGETCTPPSTARVEWEGDASICG